MRALGLLALAFACVGAACSPDTSAPTTGSDTTDASAGDADALGCPADGRLFGAPSANTGLSAEQCGPRCGCFEARAWSAETLAALEARVLDDAASAPAVDPYTVATLDVAPPPAGSVCAVLPGEGGHYRLESFADADAAEAAGGFVTHAGRCGLCSSLADLAVYAGSPDLTAPVRACGIEGMGSGHDANVACLEKLGFTPACAAIWAYNTQHTRERCLDVCLANLKASHHLPDGSLNPCIACDEVESGPVFKAVAGRTRRNSGLASALCRPCETVAPIAHAHPFLEPTP
ncbi:MAG: hypothetical protein RIT45_342 [Pseudomonadota bacterium]